MTKPTAPARKGTATPAAATRAAPSPLKVNPPAGWVRQSAYGTLKDERGNPLVRLEDVHALLMERDGLVSAEAARRVFGPFVSDANSALGMEHGVATLQSHLCIVDPSEKAYSVGSFSGRMQLERVAGQLPYVPHHQFDKGTPEAFYYALGVVAGEVWATSGGSVDLEERLDGYCADTPFPTAEQARAILGPFAVRHELAYLLWSWGSDAEAQAAAPLVAVGRAPSQQDVDSAAQMRSMKKRKIPQHSLFPEWTGSRLRVRHGELKKVGSGRPTAELATESGLPVREITRRMKDVSTSFGQMAVNLPKSASRR